MKADYQYSDEEFEDDNERCQFRPMSKNQRIYGDFQEAYQEQLETKKSRESFFRTTYDQFRAGATIQTYSSQLEVQLPKAKNKKKASQSLSNHENDQSILGKFSLNSFLNQLDEGQLEQINEEMNQNSSEEPIVGLNEKILNHLQLVKIGEEIEDQLLNLQQLDFQRYMKQNKGSKTKYQPKYKTTQQKQLAKQFEGGYGVGFKMLEKMGYKVTKGLGKNQSGIERPVEAVHKTAFTSKDVSFKKNIQSDKDDEDQKQEQEQEISISEKLFQYRSKNDRINNFLLNLKNNFEKYQSQIYFMSREIQSFKKEEQINQSLKYQKENQIIEIRKQIQKLKSIQQNIYECSRYPHLAINYKIDLLFVKETFERISNSNLEQSIKISCNQVQKLTKLLHHFYLAKTKQSIKDYQQITAMQKILQNNKTFNAKKQFINVDTGQNQAMSITLDDENKIEKYIQLILSKAIRPKVDNYLQKIISLNQQNIKIIQLVQVIKKFDKNGKIIGDLIQNYIKPLCRNYLNNLNLHQLQKSQSILPHLVLFPWLTILKPQDLQLLNFYKKLASKMWNIQNKTLYNILVPLLKFSNLNEQNFIKNFYLSPRILYQMQKFSFNQEGSHLLAGFIQYCDILDQSSREEILQNSILPKIIQVYHQYKLQMDDKQLNQWLKRWKKSIDKISYGFFQKTMNEFDIII